MPAIKPGALDIGENIQQLKLGNAAPAAPYVLRAVIPLAGEIFAQHLAVRKTGDPPTDWFYTETERIARIHGINYYEVKAYIDSGVAATFTLDRLDGPALSILNYNLDTHEGTRTQRPGVLVNPTAWRVLYGGQVFLEIHAPASPGSPTGMVRQVNLCQRFGQQQLDPVEGVTQGKLWSVLEQPNGWYRRGRILQTLYKHIDMGQLGGLHVFATIQAETAEVQFEINWHNGMIEEESGLQRRPRAREGELGSPPPDLVVTPDPEPVRFGEYQGGGDVLFHSVRLVFGDLPLPPGSTAWTWTPQLKDGANVSDSIMRVATDELVKPISDTDPNRLHVIPLSFERPMRFAVHPVGVTPYVKQAVAVADWSKNAGGWGFTPLGLPNLTAMAAAVAAMSLTAEGETAKISLRTLTPWKGDENGAVQGIASADPFWPGSGDAGGGSTAGTGMTPFIGAKQAWTGEKGGLEILLIHQLRERARSCGALYYGISGLPAVPQLHAPGMVAPWDHFDRRFLRQGSNPSGSHDRPFRIARFTPRQVHLADYNPGPQMGGTPVDAQGEPVIGNRPDWYTPGFNQTPIGLNALSVGFFVPLANVNGVSGVVEPPSDLGNIAGSNSPDLAVPVLFQLTGATTFGAAKSVTFRTTGTGELDIEVVEDVVFTGLASPVEVQAKLSAGKFKTVRSIEVTNVTGIPVSTEHLTIGRASVGIADYLGFNGITPIDDAHSVRYHASQRALFLLTADPIAFVYLMMDAADARLTYWEGGGRANKLSFFENGSPQHGNTMARNWAFAVDRLATGMAISHSVAPAQTVDSFYETWRTKFRTNILNSVMPSNGLFQAPFNFKECQFQPFSAGSNDFDSESASKVLHLIATRETCYFTYALLMMANTFGHLDQQLLDVLKGTARGFLDLLWHNFDAALQPSQGPHAYIPVGYRSDPTTSPHPRTGLPWNRVKNSFELPLATDLWTIFANQAAIPEENPVSKVMLNPLSHPSPDPAFFSGPALGNSASLGAGAPGGAMSALSLSATQLVGGQPTVLELYVQSGGGTYSAGKRRTFKITGTDPWGIPIDDDCLGAERAGDTLVLDGLVTVLANAWPAAGPVAVTVLGGNTFGPDKTVTVRFTGTSATGSPISQSVICRGNGLHKQLFKGTSFFRTITEIRIVGLVGVPLSTEKFRFGTQQNYIIAHGNGGAQQFFRVWQNFKTITEIIALNLAQSTEAGSPNVGTTLAGESFSFGNPAFGLRTVFRGHPTEPDGFQAALALACYKHLAASEADELIKRYAGVDGSQAGPDTLLAAKNEILAWGEYAGAPANAPYVQWAPLLWTLRNVT